MRQSVALLAAALIAATSTTWAHKGVQNEAVIERMQGMSKIASNVKVVGEMARGKVAFDAETAQAALEQVSEHAAEAPRLFESKAEDPYSEASPEIWDQFDDFAAKARELEETAERLAVSVVRSDDLAPAMRRLGKSCKSCHAVYRR